MMWNSLPHMFFAQAQSQGERVLCHYKEGGAWRSLSWREAARQVTHMARFLRGHHQEHHPRCVIVADNSPQWMMADMAIMASGAVTTPLFTTHRSEDHLYCINSVRASVIFASARAFASLKNILPQNDSVTMVIMLDDVKDAGHMPSSIKLISWNDVMASGGDDALALNHIKKDDVCSIIHTSGTSSHPKGVMLSHGAILANCEGASALLHPIGLGGHRFMSFLPLAHSFERTCCQFFPMTLADAQIVYAENVEQLVSNMAEMKPTLMAGVPRLYQSMERKLMEQMRRATGIKGWLVRQTWHWGRRRTRPLSLPQRLFDGVLTVLVRRAIAKRFGGCVRLFISGGAALPEETNKNLDAFGLTVLQGYGQTEAAPIISCNQPFANHFGTVGKLFKNVELRVTTEGELCVRGDNLMKGYWNDEAATKEALRNGWLHTGDCGYVNDDGDIVITDRIKDMIVNSGGDNIAPVKIEEHLCRHDAIGQAAVFGDGLAYIVAIVVMAQEWRGTKADVQKMIDDTNRQLQPFERVKKFMIADEEFTIANQLMTPTLKLRRRAIKQRYETQLEALIKDAPRQ